ncbi:DUF3179 domain-containing (seleno)protein [Dinghuibacter silviterrae]|uniref:Uncharacterized protein DUF3179 n=1 Tax=Dinghuibacter silviterrae TaxID=1539049 RepID=A0A4R8DG21_9BACT|nr:DUF3179 domain-containing (seleno)protein [Dinghuibacter silviterrae]TDW96194.1 uncharacterized protein DUF3179 [Dinghuibacter silviterrae]
MSKPLLLWIGLIFLFALEILRVYFIMPFPGSQKHDTVAFAYFLDRNIFWLRIAALVLFIWPLLYYLRSGKAWQKITLIVVLLVYGGIFYLFNFKFLADKMFYPPKVKQFATTGASNDQLVIGVALHGEARAYPIEVIGYHHQVMDTVGGQPVLVTYCTVCRTGRVYSPFVRGKLVTFRLVGMDHFNAMFEDADTRSWWQQATGKAITGPLKGQQLQEIPSAQMTLVDWQMLHPNSLTMQPDPNFASRYDSLKGYDEGTIKSSLEKRDTGSWQFKSWVIGVESDGRSKAYDWNNLVRERIITDTLGGLHLLLTIEPNNKTFYAFSYNDSLRFQYEKTLRDINTRSTWQPNGVCTDGPLKGARLQPVQAYQEFWHSWRTFHPATAMVK